MIKSLRLCAFSLAVAVAAPAAAQPTTRDHRDRKPPPAERPNEDVAVRMEVTAWTPKTARPGATITIDGRGFGRSTTVLVGGRPVRATVTPSKITFPLPAVYGDGELRLRKPNVANDYVVGTLVVDADPALRAVSPASGPAGTRVEIRGKAFASGDEIRMNGRAMPVAEYAADRLVIVIPDWARTDHLALVRAGVERARSRRPFRVDAPAPIVGGLSPEGGAPATTVRVTGQNFGPTDRALYGGRPTQVIGRGNGWIDVVVPGRARTSEYIHVRGPGGEGRSPREFRLEMPAVIAGVRPTYGAPASQFTITGSGFQAADQIFLGGKKADIVQLQDRRIVALVPHGTAGGEIVLRRVGSEVRAQQRFDVVNLPTLTGFTPTRGEAGAKVKLTGTWLEDAQVWYGGAQLKPARLDAKSIEVLIPAGATDQKFRVKTRGGEATTDRAFQVMSYGVISDARPRKVAPGATLTLLGDRLDQIEKIYLNNLELPIALNRNRTASVTIPANARDGKLAWVSHGRRAETTWEVSILYPPSIAAFQPEAGKPGTKVIVRGKDFDGRTRLFYGDRPMRIGKRGPNELVAQIPSDARGKDYLWVQGDGARVRSSSQFTVLVAPDIRDVSPRHGRPGDKVTIRGDGFDGATEILIGTWRAAVEKRGDGVVYIEVPRTAKPGSWDVSARSGPLSSTWGTKFTVDAPAALAQITGFSPKIVEHGGTVTIDGTNFTEACKVYVTGKELPVTRRDRTHLWVIVPNTVKGEHWLELVEGDQRSRSAERITIVDEKTKGGTVKVRDHRDKKESPGKPAKPAPGGVDVRDHRDKPNGKKPGN